MLKGSKNLGLATELGVNVDNTTFSHPEDPDKLLFWLYDITHLLKNIRNHLLDDYVTLPGGYTVCVDDFWHLIDKVKTDNCDHTSGFHLSDEHLNIEGSDRQDYRKCMDLLSDRTANCFEKYFVQT